MSVYRESAGKAARGYDGVDVAAFFLVAYLGLSFLMKGDRGFPFHICINIYCLNSLQALLEYLI